MTSSSSGISYLRCIYWLKVTGCSDNHSWPYWMWKYGKQIKSKVSSVLLLATANCVVSVCITYCSLAGGWTVQRKWGTWHNSWWWRPEGAPTEAALWRRTEVGETLDCDTSQHTLTHSQRSHPQLTLKNSLTFREIHVFLAKTRLSCLYVHDLISSWM